VTDCKLCSGQIVKRRLADFSMILI
jgi:hypothetical protein